MRHGWLLVILLLAPPPARGQSETATGIRTEYVRLDHVSKAYGPLFGRPGGSVAFNLVEIRNMDTGEVVRGVEVDVGTVERESVGGGSSLAFANLGSLWSGGGGAEGVYRTLRNSGFLFLEEAELQAMVDFLNDVTGEAGRAQERLVLYKLSLREGFELGLMYDADDEAAENRWKFTLAVHGTALTLGYADGVAVLQKLNAFTKQIEAAGTAESPGCCGGARKGREG